MQDAHLPDSAKRLKAARSLLWERAETGSVGGFAWEYAHIVDRYFEERILEGEEPPFPFVLVAVGGYGRGRLCPGSDVDVILILKRRIPASAEAFVKHLLYPLWDLGLDLGHGVRTVSDCISLASKDFQVLASLLDARPLAGDAAVFNALLESFGSKVLKRKGGAFVAKLREHNQARAGKYGDATAMLEPELKNGLGGLRDGQQVVWLARVMEAMGLEPLFLPDELVRLREDQAFLNRVRTALHISAGRKADRLFFDLQPPTARLMGFVCFKDSPSDAGRGVEFFLSRLHQAMTRIKGMRDAVFQERFTPSRSSVSPSQSSRVGVGSQGVYFVESGVVSPQTILDGFLESARSGVPLTWAARRQIRSNPGRIAAQLVDRPETLCALVEIFLARHVDVGCQGLVETGLLSALLPEFGSVEHLIQFNDYHVHPVGWHTMATISRLSSFLRDSEGWAAEIARRVQSPSQLVLAGFFHDMGKGETDHCEAGAQVAQEVLTRFGMSETLIETVVFCVRHHLLIPKIATRRDLTDERIVSDVAAIVGTVERLDILYLLSVGDSMSTGPRAWSSWTRALFAELYFKVKRLLEHGPLSQPESAARMQAMQTAVAESCLDMDAEYVEAALSAMPVRAFLALDVVLLSSHLHLVKGFWEQVAEARMGEPAHAGEQGIHVISAQPGRASGTYQLSIVALDRPGLFAMMVGAIRLHGLDILSADLFTWKDDTAVDVFTVTGVPEMASAEEMWSRISRSLGLALRGKLDIASRLAEQRQSPLHKTRKGPKLGALVTVDNAVSDFHTIVEVAASDRAGLLFDMARTLSDHGLSIELAKITTIKGRAADVFHVRDRTGAKLMDDPRIETLRIALLEKAS